MSDALGPPQLEQSDRDQRAWHFGRVWTFEQLTEYQRERISAAGYRIDRSVFRRARYSPRRADGWL